MCILTGFGEGPFHLNEKKIIWNQEEAVADSRWGPTRDGVVPWSMIYS